MSNTAVAMPLGISCVGMHGMVMADMPCCQSDPDMEMGHMGPHSGEMGSQCMAICAETHAPGGLRFSEIADPTPVWIRSVIWISTQYFVGDQLSFFPLEFSYHPPPLLNIRLTI